MASYIVYLDPESCSWCDVWYKGFQRLSADAQSLFELKHPSQDAEITQIPAIRDVQTQNVMTGGAALQFLMKHMDEATASDFKRDLDQKIQARRAAAETKMVPAAAAESQPAAVGGWQNDIKQLLFGGSILKRSLMVLLLIGISVFAVSKLFGVSPLSKLAAALPGVAGGAL